MNDPRITVVTPSFNQGAFLEQTIQSVLNQNYPNLEYMVVDGASTDQSVDIIRRYADRLTYWVSEPDKGQTEAINKGLARATGDILAYVNSDDLYEPGSLAHVAELFTVNPAVDVIYGGCQFIDEQGHPLSKNEVPSFDLESLLLGNFIAQPATFWTRSVWERVGRFDESLHYVMDYDYWLRCASLNLSFMSTTKTLARMRHHAGAKTFRVEVGFWREAADVVAKLFAESRLPVSPVFVERILSRFQWMQAISLEESGGHAASRTMVAKVMAQHDLFLWSDDVNLVFSRIMRNGRGETLTPMPFFRRLRALGLCEQRVAREAIERYLSQASGAGGVAGRLRRLCELIGAGAANPRLLKHWSFRQAVRRALRGK